MSTALNFLIKGFKMLLVCIKYPPPVILQHKLLLLLSPKYSVYWRFRSFSLLWNMCITPSVSMAADEPVWFILHFPRCFCCLKALLIWSFSLLFSDNHETLYLKLHHQGTSHSPLTGSSHTHSWNYVPVVAMFHHMKLHTALLLSTDCF